LKRKPNLKPLTVEGYVWVVGFGGDDVFVHPAKPPERSSEYLEEALKRRREVWSREAGVDLLELIERFEGRRVRVTVEERRITIEALE